MIATIFRILPWNLEINSQVFMYYQEFTVY